MTVLLWIIVILGVLEMVSAIGYALNGEVPQRTPGEMAFNAALMFSLALWAFWLLRGAA